MGVNQTTIQNEKAVVIGSAAVFFSTNKGASFTNLGIANDIAYTEELTPMDAQVDNGTKPRLADGVASQKASVTANLLENDYANIAALRGNIDNLTTTTATPVVGATHTFSSGTWKFLEALQLPVKSSVIPTAMTVTGTVDTSTWVEGTDYNIVPIGTNTWGVQVIDSTTVTTEAQDVVISAYTYTPVVGTKVTTGGNVIQERVWIKMYNRTPDTADAADALVTGITLGDKIFRTQELDFYYGTVSAGDAQTFKSKDDTDPIVAYPLAMEFKLDDTRSIGDQLYSKDRYIELQSSVTL